MKDLILHLKNDHKLDVQITTHNFASKDEFLSWKSDEQEKSSSSYVQHSSNRKYGTKMYQYLYCNRSGKVRLRGKGKRHIKTQGSSKIDARCIANMKVMTDTITGSITVKYCSTHTGHLLELAHLPISSELRLNIAAKLHDGVPVDVVLDSIRDSMPNGNITRKQLLSRQDILNIKKQLNIKSIMKHSNDLTSVCAWVEELQNEPNNPILLFKPQGMPQSEGMNNLGNDDFLIVIQTPFQKYVMRQYGNKAVLMDATQSTTQYKFLLISIVVIDDYGEGVPVAWAISNREDTTLLIKFLKGIHANVGEMKPEYFMSDCADQYFQAWSGVFTRGDTKRLLCIWHVDCAWRKALNDHVSVNEIRVEIIISSVLY